MSVFHALGLLLSMFLLAPMMEKIPLAALAGVLMVTAYRMLERAGLVEKIGRHNFFWSSDQAIVESEKRVCPVCQTQAE